jgi:hypothetical protein
MPDGSWGNLNPLGLPFGFGLGETAVSAANTQQQAGDHWLNMMLDIELGVWRP